MKKAEFYHRLKQVEYLEQVNHRFEALRLAFIRFNEIWQKDHELDIDLNDYLVTMYPFPKSFDDLLKDFALWYGDGASKIVRAKNEIQPRLSIQEINEMVEEPEARYGEEATRLIKALEHESEERMKLIQKLRKTIRDHFCSDYYYVITVHGDVEPELSVKSKTAEERDWIAKRIWKDDDQDLKDGIYWLNIVDGVPEIGSYSGGFFEDGKVEEPAPYYTKKEAKGKFVCAVKLTNKTDCVRYHLRADRKDGWPVLYDSIEEAEADTFFDPLTDTVVPAVEFKEDGISIVK